MSGIANTHFLPDDIATAAVSIAVQGIHELDEELYFPFNPTRKTHCG